MRERPKEEQKSPEGDSNIVVAIRVRPLSQKQVAAKDIDIIRAQDNLIIALDPVDVEFEMKDREKLGVLHRSKQQRYTFDKIYRRDEPSELIYEETTKSLITTVIQGKNATVFAYGPTGTGKTYTMLGNKNTYGLNVLAIRDIFTLIGIDSEYDYSVNITYVEIYNEMIRDLLVPTSAYLELRDDGDKGISITGVTEFRAESTEQVMELLLIGNRRRTTEATNANQTSSRSHAVFQINVAKTPRTKNTCVETLSGKLSLIDLAGSERGTVTENRGIRLMEGAKINRSLLALANCINALGDKNKKGFFVPYRDSKLTRLLKDSLGGNCRTVMIANISPASSQFEETINTLKYANRAKNIKTKPLTNKKLVSIHISEYKNIINDLRQEIEQLKTRIERNGATVNQRLRSESEKYPSGKIEGTQNCNCGRLEQAQEIKKIKEQIFANFNERIQLRRGLMQLEEQNTLNILQIKKKEGELAALKRKSTQENTAETEELLEEIQAISRTIHTLKLSTHRNMLKKEITNLELAESMVGARKIKEEIPKKVRSSENREFLEIIIKNHILELQNIELEINLQMQERIILRLRDVSDSQRNFLEEKGFDFKDEEDAIMTEDERIELELEEEEDDNFEDDLSQRIQEINNETHCKIIEQTEQKNQYELQGQQNANPSKEKGHYELLQQQNYHQSKENDHDHHEMKSQLNANHSKKKDKFQFQQQRNANHSREKPSIKEIQEENMGNKNHEFGDQHFGNYTSDTKQLAGKQATQAKKQVKDFKDMSRRNNHRGEREIPQNRQNEDSDSKRKNQAVASNKKGQNLDLGVIGFNNGYRKREKTLSPDHNMNSAGLISNKVLMKNFNSNTESSNLNAAYLNDNKEQASENSQLGFNLKGVNVKLNEKLPFVMVPKEKKKK